MTTVDTPTAADAALDPGGPVAIPGALPPRALIAARDRLEGEGWVHVEGEMVWSLTGHADPARLMETIKDLPVDPYGDGQRQRLYRTAQYYPWARMLTFEPTFPGPDGEKVPYYQSAATNADAQGDERRFHPIPDELASLCVFCGRAFGVVACAYQMIPGGYIEARLPVRVGVHIVRLNSDGRRICTSSPNTLHVDGEPWTAVLLLERANIHDRSARSYISTRGWAGYQPQDIPDTDILAKLTLTQPFELLMVDDSRVAHSVTGALGADGKPGWRTAMLIDFSGIRLDRTAEPAPIY